MKPRRTSLLRVEELERREVLTVNPGFANVAFPVLPGSLSPPAHSVTPLGPAPFQITPAIPDLRGTYSGPSTSPATGRTDQLNLQIEQQVTDGVFQAVTLPNRRGVPMKRLQQQLGHNFPWVALPDGRVVTVNRPVGQAGNNFQGTFQIAGLGMTFTVFGTFGLHGQFRAAGVDGKQILVLRGTFLKNQDGTATLLLNYRLQTARGPAERGNANLTGTPGVDPTPTLPAPLF
jgi:hypothetical protein